MRVSLFCSLILSVCLSSTAFANTSLESLKQARLAMYRSAVAMISHRGERIDETLEQEAKEHLSDLQRNLAEAQSESVHQALKHYSSLVNQGLSYDIHAEDYDWDFNLSFSDGLRELDTQIRRAEKKAENTKSAESLQLMEQAVRLEYMSVRYVARAYVGELHTLSDEGYFDQDLTTLAQDVNKVLSLDADSPSIKEASRYWQFIRSRYEDYSTELTPYIVARNSRKISSLMIRAAQQ